MRDRERGLRSCSKKTVTLFSQERPRGSGRLLLLHFRHSPPPSPLEFTPLPLCTHTHTITHVQAHTAFTSLFLWRNTLLPTKSSLSQGSSLLLPSSHSQVPILSSVCLLYSLHNAGINFSKPIWAAACFGKERRAELLCRGKFPLHTSLEVDGSPLYAACFNLHTEQRERGIEGRQEGERALNTQLGITNVFTEVASPFPCASLNPFASSATFGISSS